MAFSPRIFFHKKKIIYICSLKMKFNYIMKTIIKTAVIALALTAFVSCSDPLDKVYNQATIEDDLQTIIAHDKVSKQELENLAYYVVFASINGTDLEGKTYRELITEANKAAEEK